jgi:hypothetical protein
MQAFQRKTGNAIARLGGALLMIAASGPGRAQTSTEGTTADQDSTPQAVARSPWLATPLLSSNPKFGTSIGGLVGYLHKYDRKSPVSMFGVTASYSDTNSYKLVLFANTYFDEDRQRINAAAIYGNIENDYEDFLGTGQQSQTTDKIDLYFLRYLYRFSGNWFIGAQGVMTNYSSSSATDLGQGILDILGLGGFQSNGLGAAIYYDSRDNTRSASRGSQFLAQNIAYRERLGGDASFDVYIAEYDTYLQLIGSQVTAIQLKGRWTSGAPNSSFSSVELPGYTRGEYLAQNMTFLLIDQRIMFNERWGMSLTAGIGCLYGDSVFDDTLDCFERDNAYPSISSGVIYSLKPAEKIVLRAQVSAGKSGNSAFVLSFGQPF